MEQLLLVCGELNALRACDLLDQYGPASVKKETPSGAVQSGGGGGTRGYTHDNACHSH